MRSVLSVLAGLALLLLIAGCVSKNKADAQARSAFIAGQRQAVEMMHQAQFRGPTITFVGEVSNPTIPWTDDLTLAKAIVAAGYRGSVDPNEILIVRQGKAVSYDPNKLLSGEDVPLEPNDIVELRHR